MKISNKVDAIIAGIIVGTIMSGLLILVSIVGYRLSEFLSGILL